MNAPTPAAISAMPGLVQHITTSLDVGGAQSMLVKLVEATAAKRNGVRPAVLSLMRPGSFTHRLRQSGCPTYTLGMARGYPGPIGLLRLLRITGMLQPDLLQGWMYHGNLAASMAQLAVKRRVPLLWNVRHSLADPKVEKWTSRALLSLSARLSRNVDGIIYNSRTAANEHAAFGFDASRAIHIPNGFDLTRYRPDAHARQRLKSLFGMADDGMVIGMVARNHPMKDHVMLVRAIGKVRASGRDCRLLLVGPGMDAPGAALMQAIGECLPPDAVTFAGERADVADWLPGVDIVALSSAWGEAFPNILGEAMACGVPCVATDVGDSAWVMGEGGRSVPPRDADAMAAALAGLADLGDDARRAMGAAGRSRAVAHFDINDIAVRYRRLYASAVRHAMQGSGSVSASALASEAGAHSL
ncbi:glycosyl transferase family 1 [Sphingobium lactosutens]|uniref:glycosyltransferase n=1 Tax=Sphingobium lactosutens TaxID=522773 RepID=UPI0015C002C3|nr:glycosyltransferase [Sphingobium lactosutens]NWK98779.1 glycosyl transferase family 1 [Sphingobium lactosutens]